MEKKSILVIGAGSWGTALALVLARNNHQTLLWDSMASHVDSLIADKCNNYHLPGHDFPDTLIPVKEFDPLPETIGYVLVVVPCEGLRSVLQQLQAFDKQHLKICLACKGLEPDTLTLNHLVVEEYLPTHKVAILSGPSFAKEVAEGLPTAVTIASEDSALAEEFSALFHCDVFRTYTHDDIVGVQIGGAIKNVMAIAAGIADGLHFGANTRAALISRGLSEIMRLGLAMGGRADTFMGLAGLGDLVLTCTDDLSRNRRFGLALAKGLSPDEAKAEIGQAVEGLRTSRVVCDLADKYDVDMPISREVLKVINGEISPHDAVLELLGRERKAEV
ncbi:MAG: NAD(P)H-dependent glycerol-3-phosphate dehydrogenase [Gammaproteobacteria bacterium]|nr:NAD(P)H-dependent glycerol-3-phosphate dehydrogenase [Gammaproteobacteria bacterium]